jgi:hypothetical protein
MNVVMLFPIISKDMTLDVNSMVPLGQTVRGQAPINFMVTF